MNVTVTVETTNQDQTRLLNTFQYDYSNAKAMFMKKMAAEVNDQMGQTILPAQMEEMMRQAHPEAVFDFAVCSDWILENIATVAQTIRTNSDQTHKVIAFEMFDEEGVSLNKYDNTHELLGEMMGYMNNDFNEMIKTA